MTKEELAALLNGRQYRNEMTKGEEAAAKTAGLVVIFGASDDLMEIRGAVDDEVYPNGDGTPFTGTGLLKSECEDDDCPYFAKMLEGATGVYATFDDDGYTWTYDTAIPHATFDILEDDVKYCRGIVFALADVPA